jgi:hypothetical protein
VTRFVVSGVFSVIVLLLVTAWIGGQRQRNRVTSQEQALFDAVGSVDQRSLDSGLPENVPAPVARYLRRAVPEGASRILIARLEQEGTLRTGVDTDRWFSFTARHVAAPPATGFLWNARVAAAPLIHLRVVDAFIEGQGSGRVTLLSAFTVGSDEGTMAMNSGAQHRYLAEAVWYPTALFPSPFLTWRRLDDARAVATLTVGDITVSLEFRFGDEGEVTGIFTPGRWGRFADGYAQVGWEGHFSKYEMRDGFWIPTEGEVGWYVDDAWRPVWRGRLTDVQYELAP